MSATSRFQPFTNTKFLHTYQLEACGELLECLVDTFLSFDIQTYIVNHITTHEDVDKEIQRIRHVLKTMEGQPMMPYRSEYPQKHRGAIIRLNKLFKALLWVRDNYPHLILPQEFFYEKNTF